MENFSDPGDHDRHRRINEGGVMIIRASICESCKHRGSSKCKQPPWAIVEKCPRYEQPMDDGDVFLDAPLQDEKQGQ